MKGLSVKGENQKWSIQLLGQFNMESEQGVLRPRIVHQQLLIARLVLHHPSPINRSETANFLWPKSENAHAYLRRAIMELRAQGVPIQGNRDKLFLPHDSFESDLDSIPVLQLTNPQFRAEDTLRGIDHPVAEEIRAEVRKRMHFAAVRTGPATRIDPKEEIQQLFELIGSRLIACEPEYSIEILASSRKKVVEAPFDDALLEVGSRLLTESDTDSSHSATLRLIMGRKARLKTHYSAAQELLQKTVTYAQLQNDKETLIRAYYELALVSMETREWDSYLLYAHKCFDTALSSQTKELEGIGYACMGTYKLFNGKYEETVELYQSALKCLEEGVERDAIYNNLAVLKGIVGYAHEIPIPECSEPLCGCKKHRHSYRKFALRLGEGNPHAAILEALSLLETTAKSSFDRNFCCSLDCFAMALAEMKVPDIARALVRIGSRARWKLGFVRAPLEKDAIRKHLSGPYFGSNVRAYEQEFSGEPVALVNRLKRAVRDWSPKLTLLF